MMFLYLFKEAFHVREYLESNVKLMNWKGFGKRQLWPIRVLSQHFPSETEEKYKSYLSGFRTPLYTATPACSVRSLNQNCALIYCFP